MNTYVIEIDEQQRLALIELLSKVSDTINEDHPLDLWKEMLGDLPEDREAIHNFCL